MENLKAKEIRAISRKNLKGHWGQAILILVIYVAIISILTGLANYFLPHFLNLIVDLINIPLAFGFIFYFLNLSKGTQQLNDLFQNFTGKCWLKSLGTYILFSIGAIVCSIPAIIILVLFTFIGLLSTAATDTVANQAIHQTTHYGFAYGFGIIVGIILGIAIIVIIFIPTIIYSYTYSQIYFVFLERKDLSIIGIFKESRLLMRGNKWRLFRLQISYIGWVILAIIPLGIGLLWFIPYLIEGDAIFYKTLINKNNEPTNGNNFENKFSLDMEKSNEISRESQDIVDKYL